MSHDTLRLTDQKVLSYAQDLLEEHLPLAAAGCACTTDDLLKVLLGVAANTGTLECHPSASVMTCRLRSAST